MRWMDAGACGVQRKLADRNAHAIGAEITEPEYAFTVSHDDDLGVFVRPILQDIPDLAAIIQRDIKNRADCDKCAETPDMPYRLSVCR